MDYLISLAQQTEGKNPNGTWGLLALDRKATDSLMDKLLKVHPTR